MVRAMANYSFNSGATDLLLMTRAVAPFAHESSVEVDRNAVDNSRAGETSW
jgi:hypothetical protein